MPSRRSRSREHSKDDSRSRSRSPERQRSLPHDASPISESDYFQKSDEFRVWLKDEKRKYFDELTGDKARSYFRKFVKAWNRGKLPKHLYVGIQPGTLAATSQTAYKWNFTSKHTRTDEEALRNVRQDIGAATYGNSFSDRGDKVIGVEERGGGGERSGVGRSGSAPTTRIHGPTLPSASDLVLARELTSEQEAEERRYKRKRDKLDARDRVEDMVGPRTVGKEAILEKKRAKREGDRAFREKGDDGFEADESVLLGGGDSFKDMIAKRDAARKRFEKKTGKDDKMTVIRERATVYKEKEKATMEMFQQMAKRFG